METLAPAERSGRKMIHHRLAPSLKVSDRTMASNSSLEVCKYWRAGRCRRRPCPYLHAEPPHLAATEVPGGKRDVRPRSNVWRRSGAVEKVKNPGPPSEPIDDGGGARGPGAARDARILREDIEQVDEAQAQVADGEARASCNEVDKVCDQFLKGNCSRGEGCQYLHAWFVSDCFSYLTRLEGHQKAINGIALPSGMNKLFTGSKDGSLKAWDCDTGKCVGVLDFGVEIGCVISEGPWIFVGIPNTVMAWNFQSAAELSLSGPTGQVHALVVGNEMLFAGTQDGSISSWKSSVEGGSFEPPAKLSGHRLAVVSLVVGAKRLYSGSMDHTIRVWNLETLECMHTLKGHTSVVMSLICWDSYLLSCSLDGTIKVWVAIESGDLEVAYTHKEEHGILALCGICDEQARPVLMCSNNDNCVHLYGLPSFSKRGRIFSKEEVRAIQIGPDGLFFTGDGGGEVKVWRWLKNDPHSHCTDRN